MKNIIFFTLLLTTCSATAQSITKSKILGTWKPVGTQSNGKFYPITDEVHLRKIIEALSPESAGGDSEMRQKTMKIFVEMFKSMEFDFKSDDSVRLSITLTIEGQRNTDKTTAHFSLDKSKLTIDNTDGKSEMIDITMPDPKTLIFKSYDVAGGDDFVLKKQ